MNKIDILEPSIFVSNDIIAGVTKRNDSLYPGKGFSMFPGKILTAEEVSKFREMFAGELEISPDKLKFQRQTHEDLIRLIDNDSPEIQSDGMITNAAGLIINVTIADCCALLAHDPINNAVGAFHSGWKGTSLNIAKKGIERMAMEFGSKPENLRIFLSPCAGGDKYEVRRDVADLFPNSIIQISDDKFLLDIRKEIKAQLLFAGVQVENIEISAICTISDKNYHSYRRDKELSGRMSAFIGMK